MRAFSRVIIQRVGGEYPSKTSPVRLSLPTQREEYSLADRTTEFLSGLRFRANTVTSIQMSLIKSLSFERFVVDRNIK